MVDFLFEECVRQFAQVGERRFDVEMSFREARGYPCLIKLPVRCRRRVDRPPQFNLLKEEEDVVRKRRYEILSQDDADHLLKLRYLSIDNVVSQIARAI